jgi:hypothetical protein
MSCITRLLRGWGGWHRVRDLWRCSYGCLWGDRRCCHCSRCSCWCRRRGNRCRLLMGLHRVRLLNLSVRLLGRLLGRRGSLTSPWGGRGCRSRRCLGLGFTWSRLRHSRSSVVLGMLLVLLGLVRMRRMLAMRRMVGVLRRGVLAVLGMLWVLSMLVLRMRGMMWLLLGLLVLRMRLMVRRSGICRLLSIVGELSSTRHVGLVGVGGMQLVGRLSRVGVQVLRRDGANLPLLHDL